MNQKMYIATWDTQIVLKTKRYSHYEIKILSKDASFNIDENSVPHTLKCGWHVQQISALYILFKQVLLMNQTMYIATWDKEIFFKTKPYWRWEIKILSKDASFNIDENAVPHILKCVWHRSVNISFVHLI